MKKVISILLSAVIVFSTFVFAPINASAYSGNDYLYWAQNDSSKPWYNLSIANNGGSGCEFYKYGCWIMAYDKMLIECGAANQNDFGPVEMVQYIRNSGLTDNGGYLVANHQQRIANDFKITYEGKIDCYNNSVAEQKILEQVDLGKSIIVRFSGHSAVVDNERTKQNGYATLSNSDNDMNYNTQLNSSKMINRYGTVQFIDVFSGDTQAPVVNSASVTKVTNKGYTVTCSVSDNKGVTSVKFPTWQTSKGSEGCTWYDGTKVNDNTWTFTYNNATVSGKYSTYIYAYDAVGNRSVGYNVGARSIKCKVNTPQITFSNYYGGKKVTIKSSTSGATIYYKTSKNAGYKKYSGAFNLTASKTVYAYAKKNNYTNSASTSKKINVYKVSSPTIGVSNCVGGKYVSLSSNAKDVVSYYKLGSKGKYKKYTGKFKITSNTTVYAYTKKSGYVNSAVSSRKITGITKLSKPTGVKATATSYNAIKISWKKVSGASGYYIYRSTSKSGKYAKVATVSGNSKITYTNTGLAGNKIYYYKVYAYGNGRLNSSGSSIVNAKAKLNAKNTTIYSLLTNYDWTTDDMTDGYYYSFSSNGYFHLMNYYTNSEAVGEGGRYTITGNYTAESYTGCCDTYIKYVYTYNPNTDTLTYKYYDGCDGVHYKYMNSGYMYEF